MRYFACLFVGLCICASVLDAAEPNKDQLGTSEKQLADKQRTQNPEAYALYLKGRSYWSKRTLPDLETAASYFNRACAEDPDYALARLRTGLPRLTPSWETKSMPSGGSTPRFRNTKNIYLV
jgi:hypothetical protein